MAVKAPQDRRADSPDLVEAFDLTRLTTGSDAPPPALISTDRVADDDAAALSEVGVLLEGEPRSGTYIMRDFHALCAEGETDDLEILPIAEALKRYDWLREKYYWQAVPADLDDITARCAAQPEPVGFFVRVRQGAKVAMPCQAALYMASADIAQILHNIVILEEDSELNLITGCVSGHGAGRGVHFAVTENYIGPNAALTSTMVHSWGPEISVRPRSGTIVEAGGSLISSYVSLRPAKDIQSNPRTWLNGEGASAKYLTIILGSQGATIDIGGEVYLNGEDTSAELAHRGVCTGGHIYQKGLLYGNADCRAHIDCAGLLLDPGEDGFIESIPGLFAMHPEARMSHEASIGKIAPEQVEYLQARGMEEREAISMIIRGFLDTDIEGLGPELDARIAEIVELAGHGEE